MMKLHVPLALISFLGAVRIENDEEDEDFIGSLFCLKKPLCWDFDISNFRNFWANAESTAFYKGLFRLALVTVLKCAGKCIYLFHF